VSVFSALGSRNVKLERLQTERHYTDEGKFHFTDANEKRQMCVLVRMSTYDHSTVHKVMSPLC